MWLSESLRAGKRDGGQIVAVGVDVFLLAVHDIAIIYLRYSQ